ncbi:MAG TPA: hypothetical protein VG754_01530 [Verrucomicrobiae bacterium]|jgi:hypothetical protein|nr:hypothetical protein [Verrucomicrobiae bacterium]
MKSKSCFLFLAAIFFAAAPLRADSPTTFNVGEFTFTRPAKWEWVEVTSSMRKAQLKVIDADGKASADVVFFQFGPQAGSVKANVDRWLRQFDPSGKEPKIEETTIGKTKVTYVEAEGTYHSGMPGGPLTPMPDSALMGAIMESEDGNVFVKMTGPKALVKASIADFKKMIESGPKK